MYKGLPKFPLRNTKTYRWTLDYHNPTLNTHHSHIRIIFFVTKFRNFNIELDENYHAPEIIQRQCLSKLSICKEACWHVYRKSVFFIDGNNNNNDGRFTNRVYMERTTASSEDT
jgi:hypothetical protein